MTDSAPTEEKPWLQVCVTKANEYLIKPKPGTGTPPARVLMPWVDQGDPRMFVRNGELIKPYGIVEFAFIRMESCPELDHDRACYKELARAAFDPNGSVPITYFDLEKLSNQLNSEQEMVEKSIPDAPMQDAA